MVQGERECFLAIEKNDKSRSQNSLDIDSATRSALDSLLLETFDSAGSRKDQSRTHEASIQAQHSCHCRAIGLKLWSVKGNSLGQSCSVAGIQLIRLKVHDVGCE